MSHINEIFTQVERPHVEHKVSGTCELPSIIVFVLICISLSKKQLCYMSSVNSSLQ